MKKSSVNGQTDYSFISPAHIRAARGWLHWNLNETQEKSGLDRMTISRFELGKQNIANSSRALLYETFKREGVELRPDGLHVRKGQ